MPMEKRRQPYERPKIVRVRLVRDELAATACKNAITAGPDGARCRGTFPPLGICRNRGS
jgi:hypothetical protein